MLGSGHRQITHPTSMLVRVAESLRKLPGPSVVQLPSCPGLLPTVIDTEQELGFKTSEVKMHEVLLEAVGSQCGFSSMT